MVAPTTQRGARSKSQDDTLDLVGNLILAQLFVRGESTDRCTVMCETDTVGRTYTHARLTGLQSRQKHVIVAYSRMYFVMCMKCGLQYTRSCVGERTEIKTGLVQNGSNVQRASLTVSGTVSGNGYTHPSVSISGTS